MISVVMACNDPHNGNFEGKASAISFDPIDTKCVCTLVYSGVVINHGMGKLQIGRLKVPLIQYRVWPGGWGCDEARIRGVDALAILNYLMRLKWWHCEQGPTLFYDKFNARQPLTSADWYEGLRVQS